MRPHILALVFCCVIILQANFNPAAASHLFRTEYVDAENPDPIVALAPSNKTVQSRAGIPKVPNCGGWLAKCVSDNDCCSHECTPEGCTCSDIRQRCHARADCCLDFTMEPPREYHCIGKRCDKQGLFGRYPDD